MKSMKKNKEFKIGFCMSDGDIKEGIKMDYDSFVNDFDMGIFSVCKEWQNKNSEIYITIKDGETLVGYICFMPLKKSTYEKYRKGLLHDSQISGDDIVPYKSQHKYNCLFCSIVIKKDYQNGIAIIMLLDALKQKILDLKSRNIDIERVLADCVTEDGIKLFSRLGFNYICSHEGGKIYELNSNILNSL